MTFPCNHAGFCSSSMQKTCGLVPNCKYKSEAKTVCTGPTPKQKPADVVDRERSGERGAGLKYDGGKPRWSLLMGGFPAFLSGIVDVLTFGARKYEAHSWRGVEGGYERYRDAMYRHLAAIESGETYDPESGLPHWDHVACNVGFCRELDSRLLPEAETK